MWKGIYNYISQHLDIYARKYIMCLILSLAKKSNQQICNGCVIQQSQAGAMPVAGWIQNDRYKAGPAFGDSAAWQEQQKHR